MSPQIETKASVGFKAGVKEYKLTYYTVEYQTKDTDILAAFRVTPQPEVPPEEAESSYYCRDNDILAAFRVIAEIMVYFFTFTVQCMQLLIDRKIMVCTSVYKALHMSGGDHIHSGTVVGKLEGERNITLGFVDLLCDDYIEKDRTHGIYFTQDWVSLPGVMPVASGGIHVWHMPALVGIFGEDSVLQFGGGTLGHPWGNAPHKFRDVLFKFKVDVPARISAITCSDSTY